MPRRPRAGIMLAYPFDERRLGKWGLPYLAQPKYNGLRCLAICTPGCIELVSSTGLPITTTPHIKRALGSLPPGVYDGELYLHKNFQRLTHIVSRGQALEECKEVQYHIFDVKAAYPQEVRLMYLNKLQDRADKDIIKIAPAWACWSREDVEAVLAEQIAFDYEGIILREPKALYEEKRSTNIMKLKPRSSDVYQVCSCLEEISIHGEPKGTLGAFQVVDADGRTFKVGSGFTAEQRKDYWHNRSRLPGAFVRIKYQALTDRGIPWFPVFVEVVDST